MAADVSARVHLVAEKLQQKAQDAQRKGNENAARALSASVRDLREAMALISEQRHLLARRRGEGDDEEDDADAHVQELATRLARVDSMLGKKADDMKLKGNENAAAALQQSARAVENGRGLLLEQQQTIYGLLGRWETLEDVISGRKRRRRSSMATSDGEEEDREMDTPHGQLIARVRHFEQLGALIGDLFSGCKEVDEVRDEMEKLKHKGKEADRLQMELQTTQEEAMEANEMLKQESLALQEARGELEGQRLREVQRQEEDAALLEQQREACQAMEELVRESDQEIRRMTQSATARSEEMQSLRVEIESLASEKERLVRAHADEIEGLQGQLVSAMDAILSKAGQSESTHAEHLQTLVDELTSEKEDLVKAHADEIGDLRLQLESATASLSPKPDESTASDAEELQSLQSHIDSLALEKEALVTRHTDAVEELQQAHANEIEDLRRQLLASQSAKSDESAVIDVEELQSLQNQMDILALEKKDLAKKHADEVEELGHVHSSESEDLRRQLRIAEGALSTKTEQAVASRTEELQLLQAQIETLTSEKESLVKSHEDEIEELRRQLDDARASLSVKLEYSELQSLRDEINNLTLEKGNFVKKHASELENLRRVHLGEIEDLQQQLNDAAAALTAKTEKVASNADELQQLRAEVGALTIEKDHLVKKHADEVDKLNYPAEGESTDSRSVPEDHEESAIDEYDENEEAEDVPVLELEEDESQAADIAAEDEVETSSGDAADVAKDFRKSSEMQATLDDLRAQLAEYDERLQAQQDTISALEQEQADLQEQIEILTNDKVQTIDELHRVHEAEASKLQANLNDLQAKLTDYEQRLEERQNTILALEKEQLEHEERIELLTNEKSQLVDDLHNTHGEETIRLTQCVADNEATIESLSAQLQQTKDTLAAKATEQSETTDTLERCEAELHTCRSELDAQIRESSQLKNDLEALQDAENAKSGEIDEHLTQLTSELHEVVLNLSSNEKLDEDAALGFTGKAWRSTEVAKLCSRIAPLLTNLVSVRDELRTTEEQLESIRNEGDNQKLILGRFIKTSDWRLFAKDGEEEDEVIRTLDSAENASELLAVAKTNTLRWLGELQELREHVTKDRVRLDELELEKQQEQERLVALEVSKRDLEVQVESLREQLAIVRSEKEEMAKAAERLKSQSHTANIQEQQQQAAQQQEVAELQQQLVTVRSDFERYRVRSHTALKKMEKRAELLNGMRKENEALLQQVQESNRLRDQADAARKNGESQLQEVQRTQEMMQADFDQLVMEKTRVIAELEEENQRLESEREQTDKQIGGLTLKIQELEREKMQIGEESERIKEAEQAAFQARLNTATDAAQTAKQELQKVHDALAVSKMENEKRQHLIESLELKLEQQTSSPLVVDSTHISSPIGCVPQLAPRSAEVKRNEGELEMEVVTLKASESSLRKQLGDAGTELIALQERFATTKAANAEKVFALEEQINHWKVELATASDEIRRLSAVLETHKNTMQQSNSNGKLPELPPDQMNGVVERQLTVQVQELKTELADANTELALLTRALDSCREELQEARDHLDALAPSSSEPESGEDPTGASKTSRVMAAKDEVLKKLRVQVLELQEELQTLHEEKAALELEREKEELDELQASRKHMQSEKERAMQLQRRQTLVSGFEKQVTTIVDELQQRLEDHSSAFREVCDFRDEHRVALSSDNDGAPGGMTNAAGHAGESEFEECLVMRSGVIIKAGASFQLPVICEKSGWRVVWNFSVKEDAADVSFKLSAMMADATPTEVEVVSPERMNEMSGVFQVQQDSTTLVFEWDNSFSWLNEKTLDYHVSIQEPLTPQVQKVRRSERDLQAKAKLLEDGLALIQMEAQRRSELSATLERLSSCEATKNKHLEQFDARKTEVLTQKTRFQEEMDAQKAAFSAMLREQDELEDVERSITRAWEAAVSEREDVEMTLQLAGNGAQLETLAHELEQQMRSVAEQLKNPVRVEDNVEASKDGEEKAALAADLEEVEQNTTEDRKLEAEQAEDEGGPRSVADTE
ncbi:hypothetical protein KRP22_007883 [Phytophthora ramorum]|nr:hypothetical protein KRP22_4105 [Phytophthora ramorum]